MKKLLLTTLALFLVITSFAQVDLTDGLVAHYPFNGNADNEAADEFHGTTQNNPAVTNGRLGIEDQAYNFNGTNQYISFDPENPIISSPTFTISAWAKMDGIGGGNANQNSIFIQRAYNTGQTSAIGFHADNGSGSISFAVRGHGTDANVLSAPSLEYGFWHHYLGVVSADSVKLFIDGELVDAVELSTGSNYTEFINNIDIGRHRYSGANNGLYNGDIDEVRIYNRPLNNQEVQALYYETLRAEYVADKHNGFTPLTVGFEDQSFSEMDITSWQWDFTGDGIIDSEEQNPEFTFEVGGEYNVKLIVGDGTHTDSIIMNNPITVYDLNNGLTRHYKFDGDALDSSVNESHGEAYGAEVTDRYGIPESAYAFDGENNVTVPSIANWGDELTISFWFYVEETSGNQVLFGSREGSSGATKINIRSFLQDDGTVTFQVASDNSSNTDVTSSNTAEMFGWNHVICELDLVNSTETIILNGVETSKSYTFTPRYIDQNIGFGNWKEPFASTNGLVGKIDEIRFYDRILYQEEKDELLVNDFPMADFFGTEAIYPFSGNADDITGNGNDGIVNDAILTYDRYRNTNSAYNFLSEESYIDIGSGVKTAEFPIYITAWINPTETEGVNTIVATDVWEVEGVLSGTTARIIDGQIFAAFGIWDGAETSMYRAKTTIELDIPVEEWTHIAVGFHSSDDIRIYVNGEIVDGNYEGDATEIGYTDYGFGHIGNNQNLSTHFNGDIDEVYIFDRYVYDWEIVEMANEPGMSASTNQMDFHEVTVGEVSVEQVFSVYGLNLLGDINIKAPEGFTVSLTTGSGFSSEITVPEEDGLIGITPIFVRFEPTSDNEYSGNITISSESLNDINISMTGNPETINVNTPEKDNIQIYPNPFNDIVNISNAKDIKRIVVSNIIGQRIIDMVMENNDLVMINTGELTKGIYVITLIDSNGVRKTEKMIKN
ncbi:MAG: LamG-like jellyroll fold domain-containing protein [Bacteroidales bacterium]